MKKKVKIFLLICITLFIYLPSCKDDDEAVIPVVPKLSLTKPENNSADIDFAPTFEWKALEMEGETVTYDFLLGMDSLRLFAQQEGLTSPSYTLEGFQFNKGKTYYWQTVARYGGTSAVSDVWKFTTIPPGIPPAPTLVAPATQIFLREEVKLSWDPVEDPDGDLVHYVVYLGEAENSLIKIDTVTEASYEVDVATLVNEQRYFWKILATDLQNGTESDVRSFKKLAIGAPDEPFLLSPSNKTGSYDDAVKLTWEEAEDPEGDAVVYDVYAGENDPPVTLVSADQSATSFELPPPLTGGTTYYWKVVAKDGSGNITNSAINSFVKVSSGAPDAPVPTSPQSGVELGLDVLLEWEASTDPGGLSVTYDVYIGEANPPVTKVASDLTDLSYLPTGADVACDITNVKTFYWRVVAKNTEGKETPSIPSSFTPQMTGTLTDVRGDETEEYSWVRLGTQIWLTQGLRARKYTDGTDITHIGGVKLQKDKYDEYYWDEYKHGDVYSGDWIKERGRVYSYGIVGHNKMAPDGWHVASVNDVATLRNYTNQDWKGCASEFHGGTDIYGLNYSSSGWRYPTNWRTDQVFIDRPFIWINSFQNGAAFLELRLDLEEWREANYHSEMMFGIRLVKD
ncbi:FISUMP domain-containing protein [Fulvivirgaceae bacterium BMA12]|uniref:FISUMP domain-containing protein n=1 Tax=Agaribacillus aureus TaxID=3051825 RepID=A0ABT8L7G9_9BACT|nr:FISUMP domain-containing protein [Fulvivirgaceae bacterium BMA12]